MKTLKIFIYCLLCHLANSEVTTIINAKGVAPSLTTITSKGGELVADANSQPTKRDSADQTGTYVGKQQHEEPFKPIYRVPYQQEQQFRPTTVRYALAGAAPQAYYQKQELTGGIQYAAPTKPTNNDGGGILYAAPSAAQRTAAMNDNIINGILYGANAYREAFFNPNYHQLHPQQASHSYAAPLPQQVKASSVATEAAASQTSQQQQQQQYYAHSNPEYERMQQLLQQQQHRPHQPQQQQIRYVIAIPIEYARQLQQQFAHVPTHASQAFALQHQNVAYRPQIHYPAAASAAFSSPPEEAPAAHTVPTAYSMQVIKLPPGLLQSLESSIYQKPAVTVAPTQQYQQPAPYYQHPQQQQHQATIYYAYPYAQQHQPQHQHQQQQEATLQQAIVRIGSTKPSATVASASASPAPTQASPVQATPSATPHFIQSKPAFLQQQHQQQQLQQLQQHHHHQLQQQREPMSYAHYTQSHAPAPPYFIRQVFVTQPAHAAPHHAPAFVPLQPPLPGGMSTKLSYAYPYAAQMHQHQHQHQLQQQHEAAAGLPYFRHPGAVHYGTHLYHPPTPLTPPNKALGPVVATRQQQQPQQHQYQHQAAEGVNAAESGPTPSSVVKYP